jgi:hypothetical protein
MESKNFYGKFSSGASFKDMNSNFYSKKNISYVSEIIKKNLKKMGISKNGLKSKTLMNIGNGRESLGLLNFDPKKIYNYDISSLNIKKFKKYIFKNNLNKKIFSSQLDISKNKLPKDKFDFIYLHGIIQHVSNVDLAVQNISSSMKINGQMWFYFYRPGSFNIFLGSLQRQLLKNININNFYRYLKKNIKSNIFIDGIMDDCYVPNRQLFYPKQYKKCLESNGCKIYGNTYLKNYYQKNNFLKFHQSVVYFVKKRSKKKTLVKSKILNRSREANVLDKELYKNRDLHHIIDFVKKIDKKNYLKIFEMVVKIEKIKQKVVKKFNNNKQLSKIEFNEIIKKIIKNIFKNYEL